LDIQVLKPNPVQNPRHPKPTWLSFITSTMRSTPLIPAELQHFVKILNI
jgi:hypothetical protein